MQDVMSDALFIADLSEMMDDFQHADRADDARLMNSAV